jgi:putative membrane-bound dehydrogenase-like protein
MLLLVCGVAAPAAAAAQQDVQLGLRLPAGFEVTEFAGSDLANDIYSMTIDPRGRAVVAGRGYVRILIDDDRDGRAERAIEFADGPKDGAMGLWWEGSSLYVTGDGGLRRYDDKDGDGRADGPSELLRAMKTGGEHDAHDIKRGPDGWLYVLCGNMTGIDRGFAASPASPVRDPIAGCVIRFAPDLGAVEVVADGLRNAYRMDFSSDGELFAYDSDNERCVSLPWYEPTRFYHVVPGGHYGWQSPQRGQFFRLPPYLPDVVAPVAYLGRGSPTGVACYRHGQFPAAYRDGFFLADWTFGRIYFLPLERSGAAYVSRPRVFLESVGNHGFAPTDLAVHPTTGDLFISIGGRGTRGAVYRVRCSAGQREFTPAELASFAPRRTSAGRAAARRDLDRDSPIAWVRRVQLALGGIGASRHFGAVWEGFTPRQDLDQFRLGGESASQVAGRLRTMFPAGDPDLDRELARTLAMLEDSDPGVLLRVAERLTATSSPVDDVHYLAAMARLRAARPTRLTDQTARALLALDRKCDERGMTLERNWSARVAEIYEELASKDPQLNARVIGDAEFGRPDHVIFAQANGVDAQRAAERFLAAAAQDGRYEWTPAVVELVGRLPPERSFPVMRGLWENLGLRESILRVLVGAPRPDDRDRFLSGLGSTQFETIDLCLNALERLAGPTQPHELATLVRAARRLKGGKDEDRLRERVGRLLRATTKQDLDARDADAWSAWFLRAYPAESAKLAGADGVDVAAWTVRLDRLDWSAGDAQVGRELFQRTGCAGCHAGARALGPDLRGAASRFSRQDLFTAIVQPSRDVSPRYQTTLVATADGRVFQGAIIYEAIGSLILQTGPDKVVRITDTEIAERRATDQSLMPAGLLDKLTDREISDLYAHLRSLR